MDMDDEHDLIIERDLEVFGVANQDEDEDPLDHIGELLPEDELHEWDGDTCVDCGAVRGKDA